MFYQRITNVLFSTGLFLNSGDDQTVCITNYCNLCFCNDDPTINSVRILLRTNRLVKCGDCRSNVLPLSIKPICCLELTTVLQISLSSSRISSCIDTGRLYCHEHNGHLKKSIHFFLPENVMYLGIVFITTCFCLNETYIQRL